MLTRQGLEEYVSDCVILLENRVVNNITTGFLSVVKTAVLFMVPMSILFS
jgi:KaiC/GvpD/RAD55 family RecA-like ATPase